MDNAPTEIELLRRVASAARWSVDSNRDDVVGLDGRANVGLNWIMANGALAKALKELAQHYDIVALHDAERENAASIQEYLDALKTVKRALISTPWPESAAAEKQIMDKYGIDILRSFLKHGIADVAVVDEIIDAIAKNASAISRIKNVHEEARARRAQKDGI